MLPNIHTPHCGEKTRPTLQPKVRYPAFWNRSFLFLYELWGGYRQHFVVSETRKFQQLLVNFCSFREDTNFLRLIIRHSMDSKKHTTFCGTWNRRKKLLANFLENRGGHKICVKNMWNYSNLLLCIWDIHECTATFWNRSPRVLDHAAFCGHWNKKISIIIGKFLMYQREY